MDPAAPRIPTYSRFALSLIYAYFPSTSVVRLWNLKFTYYSITKWLRWWRHDDVTPVYSIHLKNRFLQRKECISINKINDSNIRMQIRCHIPNLVQIGPTGFKLLIFFVNFSFRQRPSWLFKSNIFESTAVWMASRRSSIPNLVWIGSAVRKLLKLFVNFKMATGGHLVLLNSRFWDHAPVPGAD